MCNGSTVALFKMFAFSTTYSFLFLTSIVFGEDRHSISLVVMAPFPDGELTKGLSNGPSLYPAAVIAAREVNNRSDILPGFNLKLINGDSGCAELSKVAISLLRDIYENKDHQVVGIIGPACSAAALRVSSLTRRREVSLIHVTPLSKSPELEDPGKNTTYATISSALLFVQSFIQLMAYNQWNNVATLQDVRFPFFSQTHSGFINAVDPDKVVFTGNLIRGRKESFIPLDSLQSSRARVVLVFAWFDIAAELLCYAFHRRMVFPNYLWIFFDRTASNFVKPVKNFKVNDEDVECTLEQMVAVSEGVILNQFNLKQENRNVVLPLFERTYNDYYREYIEDLNGTAPSDNGNTYHDAVWAMALALHNASTNGVDLTSYTYNRNNDTKVIAQYLSQVHFDGMSGPISFDNNTRRAKTIITIKQMSNGTEQIIGTFDLSRGSFKLSEKSRFIKDVFEEQHVKIHASVSVLLMLLTIVLVVLIFLLQLVNTFWYHYHSVKATSPNLTHLVFSGCYLFSIALLILSIQESVSISHLVYAVLCNVFTWCFLLGFSLIFGTICMKIWRVYRLFKHFRNDKPGFLSDRSLVTFMIFLLAMDLIICTTWNLVDPWTTKFTLESSLQGTPTLFVRSGCTCRHVTEFVMAVTLYKGTILILLVVLSILNRRIKRKNFRHTRKINILIYGVTMLLGVGLPLYFLLNRMSIYIGYVILSTILLSTVSLCILTLFLPPLLPVLKIKVKGQQPVVRAVTKRASQVTCSHSQGSHVQFML